MAAAAGHGRTAGEVALRGSELAHHVVDVLADRQASDVVLLDLRPMRAFTDYFVIATVDNVRQMQAIVDALDADLDRTAPGLESHSEGSIESGWVLVDLGDVVVHLFALEQRAYYNIEGLWHAAQEVVRIQ